MQKKKELIIKQPEPIQSEFMKIYFKLLIFVLIIITIASRLIGLKSVPPNLSNDEISIAYDAYSISKTLKDEHNHFLPISFQSHNTYKAPLTIYLTVIPTILFGNNEYSARLASVVTGIFTVFVLGLLVYEITKNKDLALITSYVLSTTPWHIYTSRMALESNVAVFFLVLGIYLSFYGKNHNDRFCTIFSFICFTLSMYGYHTEWILTPLIICIFYALNYKRFRNTFYIITGFLLFIFLVTPLFSNYLENLGTNARANTELITADPGIQKLMDDPGTNFLQKIQVLVSSISGSYSSYINFGYIFFNGLRLIPAPDPFQVGLFIFPLLPCFIVGLVYLNKHFKENSTFVLLWVIVSPFVPSLTSGGFNMVRNLATVAPYSIVIANGLYIIFKFIRRQKILVYSYTILILLSFLYFTLIYCYHFPKENGENFQYGYKQIALYINQNYSKYEKIVIDPKFGEGYLYDGVPHLYIPYYTNLPPPNYYKIEALRMV